MDVETINGLHDNSCHDNSIMLTLGGNSDSYLSCQKNGVASSEASPMASGIKTSDNRPGFETFVMTGDMIIRTQIPQKAPKKSGIPVRETSQKTPVKGTGQRSGIPVREKQKSDKQIRKGVEETVTMQRATIQKGGKGSSKGGRRAEKQRGMTDKSKKYDPENISRTSLTSSACSSDTTSVYSQEGVVDMDSDVVETPVTENTVLTEHTPPALEKNDVNIDINKTEIEDKSDLEKFQRIEPETPETNQPDISQLPVNETELEAVNRKDMVTSKSAEKIQFSPEQSRTQGLVRNSRSHENCLESTHGITMVDIDIDDKSSSVDVLNYEDVIENGHDSNTNCLTSRSVESSPVRVRTPDNRRYSNKVFMPGFIALDSMPDDGHGSHSESPVHFDGESDQLIDEDENVEHVLEINTELTVIETEESEFSFDKPDSSELSHQSKEVDMDVENTDMESTDIVDPEGVSSVMLSSPLHTGRSGHASPDPSGHRSPDEHDSDNDSIYFQPSKDADHPSALRLAKRLYELDGFKKSDVARHLSKKNEFSQLVAEEYLSYFDFTGDTLYAALKKFLERFSLRGETQERERVLAHFSHRYMMCNPKTFNSDDACHTLTCAIMLLNTDLHGQNLGRKMTCSEFIENLAELNEGENFPKDVLKSLYQAIKAERLEWAIDDTASSPPSGMTELVSVEDVRRYNLGQNPFLEIPDPQAAVEYKKGYVMRKCCADSDGRKTPLGKRGWKMYFATLRDMVLYLHKDEHGFKKNSLYENMNNAIRIHHALATKASDYTKKQHVFRLQTADWAEYLFQTSDPKELLEWIEIINFVAASLSAPPLPGAVGSQKKFQRPLLPSSCTKLNLREQLTNHEERVMNLEEELKLHRQYPPEKGAKSRVVQDYNEKETYLKFEHERFSTYAHLLQSKMAAFPELEPSLVETTIGEVEEPPSPNSPPVSPLQVVTMRGSPRGKPVQRSLSDRYSYRAAIYSNEAADMDVL